MMFLTQALPRSMALPAQAMPVRPSQRDAAAAGQPGKAENKEAPDGPEKKPTLRQTYNSQADPEKQPKLSHNSPSGERIFSIACDSTRSACTRSCAREGPHDACMSSDPRIGYDSAEPASMA